MLVTRLYRHQLFKLLHGPYHPPKCRLGQKLWGELRGCVPVVKIYRGRIPWPMTAVKRRARGYILCGDLVKAVKRESEIAVCY